MSITTARDLITSSYRLLGVLASGESMAADQADDALDALNMLTETLNLDNLMVYTINRTVLPLTIGVQDYTLGTGGTLNLARPVRIENMSVIPTGYNPAIELPMSMLSDGEWQDIVVKSVSSTFPLSCYPDGDYPFNGLHFWPIPTVACSVVLYTWNALDQFATLDDAISFPNGYKRALRYLLAYDLAPEYGMEASPSVKQIADTSREWIRRQNWTHGQSQVDSILSGTNRRSSIGLRSRGYVVDP